MQRKPNECYIKTLHNLPNTYGVRGIGGSAGLGGFAYLIFITAGGFFNNNGCDGSGGAGGIINNGCTGGGGGGGKGICFSVV